MSGNKNSKSVRKPDGKGVSKALGAGSGKIKKKIRDLERLLRRDNLPANVRVDNERALKALQVQLGNVEQETKTKKVARKYHMVRFFERKKAIRQLKQAKKAYEDAKITNDRKVTKKARTVLKHKEIDVAYTFMYPKEQKYISLFPNPKDEDDKTLTANVKRGMHLTEQKRIEFRKHVEGLMKDGKLPFSIEDILSGKYSQTKQGKSVDNDEEEIDAPQKKKSQEEDEFFEKEGNEE